MSSIDCTHLQHAIVTDVHEGTQVCCYCGLVLEPSLAMPPSINSILTPQHKEQERYYEVLDLGHNNHLAQSVIDSMHSIRETLIQQHPKKSHAVLLGFAFYLACNKHQCPRTMAEVAYQTNIAPHVIWELEAQSLNYIQRPKPSAFLPRIVMDESYHDMTRIGHLADHYSTLTSRSPLTILAAVYYLYFKDKRNITPKSIASRFGISQNALVKISSAMRALPLTSMSQAKKIQS